MKKKKKNVCKHYHMFGAADESGWNNPEIYMNEASWPQDAVDANGGSEHHMWGAGRQLSEIISQGFSWLYVA